MKVSYGIALLAAGNANAKPKSSSNNNSVNPRALLKDDMGMLNGYGCWCYFEADHGNGRGQPVDAIDQFCKTLHDGYTCIGMDAADAGITCIPWEVPYISAFGSGLPTGLDEATLKSECDNKNGADTCESWTCRVEGWFVQSYFSYSVAGGQIEASYRHANGFDPSVECLTTPGTKSADKACCNEYPHRFPFKTYGGDKACCVNHTYDTTTKVCCADGKSKTSC